MTYIVALTGGIGSGKSAVAQLFAGLGVPIVDSDQIAHELTRPGGAAIEPIRAAFGSEVIATDGSLDRPRMRARAFSDGADRRKLEAILHPLIRAESSKRIGLIRAPYVILVIPLLVEGGVDRTRYARVLVVDCAESQQIERVILRSGLSEKEARDIIATQATRENRLACADDVIDNSGPVEALAPQVTRLHEKYLAISNSSGHGAVS